MALTFAKDAALPPPSWRLPVVLVCGAGQAAMFGMPGAGELALRTTPHGCFLGVGAIEQLPVVASGLLTERPHWAGQLCVMALVNPDAYADAERVGQEVRALGHQFGLLRGRGLRVPLLLVSYLQGVEHQGAWFSWQPGAQRFEVREGGGCSPLGGWQRNASGCEQAAMRLRAGVRLNALAAWWAEHVLPAELEHVPLAYAATWVPDLPQTRPSAWSRWLQAQTGLAFDEGEVRSPAAVLPLPDPLLSLLPQVVAPARYAKAAAIGLWLFTGLCLCALVNSAWHNQRFAQQVFEDLRQHARTEAASREGRMADEASQSTLAALGGHLAQLDHHRQWGPPLHLGLGLYHGERLRPPLSAVVNAPRQPAPPTELPTHSLRLSSLSLFNVGSAVLKPGSTQVLVTALVEIKARPGALIVITGHTDNTGDATRNLHLSRARAHAVRTWMQQMGSFPDSCFAVQGLGASEPLATNDTDAGRAANRRVEIRLVAEPGSCRHPTAARGEHQEPLLAAHS